LRAEEKKEWVNSKKQLKMVVGKRMGDTAMTPRRTNLWQIFSGTET